MLTLSLEYVRLRIIPPISPAHHHYHHHGHHYGRHQLVPFTHYYHYHRPAARSTQHAILLIA